jgi:hypothetical protein
MAWTMDLTMVLMSGLHWVMETVQDYSSGLQTETLLENVTAQDRTSGLHLEMGTEQDYSLALL